LNSVITPLKQFTAETFTMLHRAEIALKCLGSASETGSSIEVPKQEKPSKLDGYGEGNYSYIEGSKRLAVFFTPALLACVLPEQVLIVDSESADATEELARSAGFQVKSVARAEFNHGGTRQMAAEMLADCEILVYMTQDAGLATLDALAKLIAVHDDPKVAAAYGRQLPRPSAGMIEAHARNFNYPPTSDLQDLASRELLGFRAIFISNSFAADRRSALMDVGGFPSNVIFGEDTITAAKLWLAGFKVAYAAEACVYHSHAHTWRQDFERYFDIGVLHSRESGQILSALVRTGLKLLGYA
jgi:rhamnosyltransferase